jgi:hypothetical protein
MEREKKRRDIVFSDSIARKELMSSFRRYADFETRGMQVENNRESAAMYASDMAFRINKLLDEMLAEVEFEI